MSTISEKLTYLNTTKQELKQGINNLGGSVTDSTTFRDYATELDAVYNNLPKVEGSGTAVSLKNTSEARLGLIPMGNIFQQTYSGKNLFNSDLDGYVHEIGGVNVIYNDEDGTITLDGEVTETTDAYVFHYYPNGATMCSLEANQAYTASLHEVSGEYYPNTTASANSLIQFKSSAISGFNFRLLFSEISNGVYSSTKTPTAATDLDKIQLMLAKGDYFNNYTVGIQFEKNSTVTDFEPYVGKRAIPNTSEPQNIQVATGENVIKIQSKNLLSSAFEQGYRSWSDGTTTYTSDKTVRTINKIDVQENISYAISVDGRVKNGNVFFYNNDTFLSVSSISTNGVIIPKGCNKIHIEFYVNSGTISVDDVSKAQLEKGETATGYVEHQEQTYPINLGNIELCQIVDYQDKIYKQNNKWYLYKVTEKINSYNGETITTDYISTTGGLDLGATIYYVLETPTDIEITDTELVEQLEGMYNAKSYDGETNIHTSCEEDNIPMKFTASAYGVDNTPNLQSKSITLTGIGTQTITADANYDGLSSVNVTVEEDTYKSGDNFSIASGNVCFQGYITGSGASLRFSVPLPKRVKDSSTFTVNDLVLTVRIPSGGYLVSAETNFLTNSNTKQINTIVTGHVITIVINGTNAWANGQNNTPVTVVTNSLDITFN